MEIVDHYINGKIAKLNNKYLDHCNPATGEVCSKVAMGDQETVDMAVSSSLKAFETWSKTAPIKRARILLKFTELLNQNINKLAEIITLEHGKTLADARGSVSRGIEVVEHCCGIANLLQGKFSNNVSTDIDVYTIRKPLGVCAGIGPFNFPIMVPVWLALPAIACGNTFIIKPSEKVPKTVMFLAELLTTAGLPAGVLNVINGQKPVVDGLLNHPDIKAVSAVGSTPVVEYIYKTAINNNKRSQTFGGAKNHCIIMPDADVANASEQVSGAAFGAAGERCMALSVAIVVGDRERHDAVVNKIQSCAKKIKVGSGLDSNSDMGPLITKDHLNKILGYIEAGVQAGANLLLDGRDIEISDPKYKNGFYLGPSIFTDVKTDMTIYSEEIFGPVLVVLQVDDYQSALEIINNNMYGNGSSIFTNDLNISRNFANEVTTGMVGINIPIPVPFVTHSFGGWKHSAFGDLAMHSAESIQFYTKAKSVTVGPAKVQVKQNQSSMTMPIHD